MPYIQFPGELEFYHFKKAQFQVPINMKSTNPVNTRWFVIHINLSEVKQEKRVDGQMIEFQKHLPIGILLYGPNLEINTRIPARVDSELATIHFSDTFLKTYFEHEHPVIDRNKSIVYEDLDPLLEGKLSLTLSAMDQKLKCHALLLDFMQHFFTKLKNHDTGKRLERFHPDDLKNLFEVAAYLRDPIATSIPTLANLASMANMGVTKFKTAFKQVFGKPPGEYHNRIRMEFARNEMLNHRKTPSEVSYMLGYAHPSNFTLAYKKHFGELPSALK